MYLHSCTEGKSHKGYDYANDGVCVRGTERGERCLLLSSPSRSDGIWNKATLYPRVMFQKVTVKSLVLAINLGGTQVNLSIKKTTVISELILRHRNYCIDSLLTQKRCWEKKKKTRAHRLNPKCLHMNFSRCTSHDPCLSQRRSQVDCIFLQLYRILHSDSANPPRPF